MRHEYCRIPVSEPQVLYQVEIPGTTREDPTVSVAAGESIVRGQRSRASRQSRQIR